MSATAEELFLDDPSSSSPFDRPRRFVFFFFFSPPTAADSADSTAVPPLVLVTLEDTERLGTQICHVLLVAVVVHQVRPSGVCGTIIVARTRRRRR